MKKFTISLLLLIVPQCFYGQEPPSDYKMFINRADSLFKLKNYKQASENYSLAFKSYSWKGAPNDRYAAARAWSLVNIADSAFDCLDRIVNKLGFSKYEEVVAEEDFNFLHSDQRWEPLLERIKRNKLPTGWFRWGSGLQSYEMVIDSSYGQDGKNVLTIRSTEERIDGFGTLMQNFLPNEYWSKRIRFTGYMKSNDVKGWAGFWLRIDQTGSKKSFAFDNMKDRPIKGTTNWKKYEIVLEVPKNASNIGFGALLDGVGQIWFEKLEIEVVNDSVPLTGRKKDGTKSRF